MFFYYPLGADSGAGALSVVTDPAEIEFYDPNQYGEINFPVYAVVTGGTAPYTVEWEIVVGGPDIYLSSFTGTTNTINASNPDGIPGTLTGSCTVTVTDAASTVATYNFPIIFGFGVQPV